MKHSVLISSELLTNEDRQWGEIPTVPSECGGQTSPIFQGGCCTGLRIRGRPQSGSWGSSPVRLQPVGKESVYPLRSAPKLWYLQAEKEAGLLQNGPLGVRRLRWCQPVCISCVCMRTYVQGLRTHTRL